MGGVGLGPRRPGRALLAVAAVHGRRAARGAEPSGHGGRPPAGVVARRPVDRLPLDARRHERPLGAAFRALARGAARDQAPGRGDRSRLAAARRRAAVHGAGRRSFHTWSISDAGFAEARAAGPRAPNAAAHGRGTIRRRYERHLGFDMVQNGIALRPVSAARARAVALTDMLGNEQVLLTLANTRPVRELLDGWEGGVVPEPVAAALLRPRRLPAHATTPTSTSRREKRLRLLASSATRSIRSRASRPRCRCSESARMNGASCGRARRIATSDSSGARMRAV